MSNTKNTSKKLIAVAWPYVNGDIHIGHLAGYLLPADITARYFHATGKDVLMVSGSDCHGTPITIEAEKKGVSPQKIVDTYHKKVVHLFKDVLDLSFDVYTQTNTEQHIKVVQDIFLKLLKDDYIIIDTTKQYYSEKEGRFLPDRYVEGVCKFCGYKEARSDQCDHCGRLLDHESLENPLSKLSNQPVQLKETQHYFVDWSKLEKKILAYLKESGPNWKKWVEQESLGWIKQGLKPRAITRDIEWGIPLPVDQIPADKLIENIDKKRIYVWFEAVIGYLSASKLYTEQGKGNWEDFWKTEDATHYYFMGKDNLVFHTIFWPGQLMAYDSKLHLPDIASINMFLNFAGKQFSKSRGVTVNTKDIVEKYGNDPVRFYLTLIMPENKDSSFDWSNFFTKNNEILVGNLGNFIHRTLSLANQTNISSFKNLSVSEKTAKTISSTFSESHTSLTNCHFRQYLEGVLKLSTYGNKMINQEKLWELKKTNPDKFISVLHDLYAIIIALAFLISPLMPTSSQQIFKLLGLSVSKLWPEKDKEVDTISTLTKQIDTSIKPEPLFTKIVSSEEQS